MALCTRPSAAELEQTDVLVIYKGDSGFMTDSEKTALEGFVKRGGGIVSIHDALCGPDPVTSRPWWAGRRSTDEVNYTWGADIPYTVVDKSNPIMAGSVGGYDFR